MLKYLNFNILFSLCFWIQLHRLSLELFNRIVYCFENSQRLVSWGLAMGRLKMGFVAQVRFHFVSS